MSDPQSSGKPELASGNEFASGAMSAQTDAQDQEEQTAGTASDNSYAQQEIPSYDQDTSDTDPEQTASAEGSQTSFRKDTTDPSKKLKETFKESNFADAGDSQARGFFDNHLNRNSGQTSSHEVSKENNALSISDSNLMLSQKRQEFQERRAMRVGIFVVAMFTALTLIWEGCSSYESVRSILSDSLNSPVVNSDGFWSRFYPLVLIGLPLLLIGLSILLTLLHFAFRHPSDEKLSEGNRKKSAEEIDDSGNSSGPIVVMAKSLKELFEQFYKS